MRYAEETLSFACEGDTLQGILTRPETPTDIGVVVIVGGPQYRVGSHRQFVLLSRALATAGHTVLRFDYRGMGDSAGSLHTFENVNADIAMAIGALEAAAPGIRRVVLWGLCDGASAALLYCHAMQDPRIGGLCLLNPWVRSAESLAKTQVKHYYTQRLREKEFWIKLCSGKVAWGALSGLARNVQVALSGKASSVATQLSFQDRMAMAWTAFNGPILLLLSGNDFTAKEFVDHVNAAPTWAGALNKINLTQHLEPEADHTFSEIRFNSIVEQWTLNLLNQLASHNAGETCK
ncbi:hydrolase 1, exosortase A system-associated [Rhodoferax sp.]|uniref:hydrolase 1, exosortase A system-associated n=1 Tax=Rhodoferax sp. TaxID=50421 RepID=UPI001EB3C7BC|nr:hydrolase 1, exosortase A system-associated [Rhodoferax sp.]MBT9505827.1 hydrolase 1, exosortase A system-associated [Rhodoferax sp.]